MKKNKEITNCEMVKSDLDNVKGGCGRHNCTSMSNCQDQYGFICFCGCREVDYVEEIDGFLLTRCTNCGRLFCDN